MFITFEGGEGCGKSTHSKLLKQYLLTKGYKVALTLEPGGTNIGKIIRKALLRGSKLVSKYSELFLFAADRTEHMFSVVNPALKAGMIVISDRFTDSTTAYQAGGRKLPHGLVRYVNKISSGGMVPDLTFLLDVDPTLGISRGTRYSKKDKFESENGGFHDRVRRTYHKIAKNDPLRVRIISTKGTVKETQDIIRRIVNEKLRNKK
jgi:dTMP kinase